MKISSIAFACLFAFLCIISSASTAVYWNRNLAKWRDFNGKQLKDVQSSSKDCGSKCDATAKCIHYTWTSENGGTCRMRKGEVRKKDVFQTNDNNMVCGIQKNSGNIDNSGAPKAE